MAKKIAISGKQTVLNTVAFGATVEGDGATALADDKWWIIDAKAAVSTLPFEVGKVFDTYGTHGITPAIGDDVRELTLTGFCKGTVSRSGTTGTIEVTDSCSGGFVQYILDGYTDLSGSVDAFLKFDSVTGKLSDATLDILNRFYDVQTSDGAGTYSFTAKQDEEVLFMILLDDTATAIGQIETWCIFSAILGSVENGAELKGAQTMNMSFNTGQLVTPTIYERTIVA